MRASVLVSGLFLASVSLVASAAHAGDQEYPVSYVERPLTLPRMTLAPKLELDIDNIGFSTPSVGLAPGGSFNQVIAGMQIGASFGITPDLEVGAIVLPIQFNYGAGYGGIFVGEEGDPALGPTLYGTYRFLHSGPVELGARLGLEIVVPHTIGNAGATVSSGAGVVISPSVPLLLHIGKIARLDAAVGFQIVAASGNATGGLTVPLSIAFDIIEPLHIGANTGVFIDDFKDAGGSARIPLGVFLGYAIGEKRPIVDIDPFFNFFDFITPGGGVLGDKVNPKIFVAGVSAKGYFYF